MCIKRLDLLSLLLHRLRPICDAWVSLADLFVRVADGVLIEAQSLQGKGDLTFPSILQVFEVIQRCQCLCEIDET